jgi:hypothetical protein
MGWIISQALYEKWHCSQALVGEYSEDIYSDGKQSAPSSGNLTQLAYLSQDKMTKFSRLSRFGMTFKPLTADRGEDLLMWYREDFLAKTYPVLDEAQELTESVPACGVKWHELSVKYDLGLCSWRTHQCLWDEELHWSSVILPRWGMAVSGVLFQHPTAERPINGTGSGLLPTPSGVNGGNNNTMGRLDEWGGSANIWRGTEIGKVRCASFEEWMMGWPTGWSALTRLETAKFQSWRQQHSES